jgi:hypothetical protein
MELGRDLAVVALLDDPSLDGVALFSREGIDQRQQAAAAAVGDRLGALQVGIVELDRLEAEPPPGPILDPRMPATRAERVSRDPDHPWDGRLPLGPVAASPEQDRREHLGGQIGGEFGIASLPDQIRDGLGQVPAVEDAEGVAVAAGDRRQQPLVRPSLTIGADIHHNYMSRSAECVTARS